MSVCALIAMHSGAIFNPPQENRDRCSFPAAVEVPRARVCALVWAEAILRREERRPLLLGSRGLQGFSSSLLPLLESSAFPPLPLIAPVIPGARQRGSLAPSTLHRLRTRRMAPLRTSTVTSTRAPAAGRRAEPAWSAGPRPPSPSDDKRHPQNAAAVPVCDCAHPRPDDAHSCDPQPPPSTEDGDSLHSQTPSGVRGCPQLRRGTCSHSGTGDAPRPRPAPSLGDEPGGRSADRGRSRAWMPAVGPPDLPSSAVDGDSGERGPGVRDPEGGQAAPPAQP